MKVFYPVEYYKHTGYLPKSIHPASTINAGAASQTSNALQEGMRRERFNE